MPVQKLLVAGGAALFAAALLMPMRGEAAALAGGAGLRLAADHIALVDPVQYRRYRGHAYCWYPSGWRGPGWYRCGFRWRHGYGWGGPRGWQGWVIPGGPGVIVRPPRRDFGPPPRRDRGPRVIIRP